MKKLTLIVATLLTLGISAGSFAQQAQQGTVPHAFKYQAVARDASGNIISNQNVSFRISIVQGSANGNTVYEETQQAATNQFGLANLSIGEGTAITGSIGDIAWGVGIYFVKVEFDPKGGTDYALMGTAQMLSVPYSLYAETAGSVDNNPEQVALVATNVAGPVNNPATGLIVYNTATSGTSPYDVTPGLYWNAGTPQVPNWVPIGPGGSGKSNNFSLNPPTGGTPGPGNTTYGGAVEDGGCGTSTQGNVVGCPKGDNNTGFGNNVLNASTTAGNTGSSNTGTGYEALYNNTTGDANTAIGDSALFSNTTGLDNTGVGYKALGKDQLNSGNSAFGAYALYNNTGSGANTAVGDSALYSNTSGNSNEALGWHTLYLNATGSRNVGIGVGTLVTNNTGNNNTGCGTDALDDNTAGLNNTALGYKTIEWNATGSANTAVGSYALDLMGNGGEVGDYNVALGDSALYNNQATGITATGYAALFSNTTGTQNVANGYEALYSNTTGSQNTAMGYSAAGNNNTGHENTSIGYSAANSNVSGYRNTSVGMISNAWAVSGIHNTAEGYAALYQNVAGSSNTAVGYGANDSWISGVSVSYVTAVGDSALFSNYGNSNTGVGYATLPLNTTGVYNTTEGYKAAYSTNGANCNTAVGTEALALNVSGNNNTVEGDSALYNNLVSNNTATGYTAAFSNTTGLHITADGYQALFANTTNSSSTAVGYIAERNLTGDANTAVGDSALVGPAAAGNTGKNNTAVGYSAIASITTGGANTAVGSRALVDNTSGIRNVSIGAGSLGVEVSAASNTVVGTYGMTDNTIYSRNTAVGDSALWNDASLKGYNNSALGYQAALIPSGYSIVNNSTAIGAYAQVGIPNAMVLGGVGSSNYEFVGIGTTTPNADLVVADASTSSNTNCHIKSVGTAPVPALTTANGFTGVAIATNSTDTKGEIDLTGTENVGGDALITITYNKSYNAGTVPVVVITGFSNGTTSAKNYGYFVYTSAPGTFVLDIYTQGSTAGLSPSFFYHVIE